MEKITLAQILDESTCDELYGGVSPNKELEFYIKRNDTYTDEIWDDEEGEDIPIEIMTLGRLTPSFFSNKYNINAIHSIPTNCIEFINQITIPVEMRKNGRIKSVPVKKGMEIKSISSTRTRKKIRARTKRMVRAKRT
jgi:hypothetical protein